MTAGKSIEYSITRAVLRRRDMEGEPPHCGLWADRLIAVLAVTAGLFIVGSYVEELLWVALAAGTVFTLGE